jgi:hypothetical protein
MKLSSAEYSVRRKGSAAVDASGVKPAAEREPLTLPEFPPPLPPPPVVVFAEGVYSS